MISEQDSLDMREVQAGRLDRFTRVVQRHQSALFRYAQSVLSSRSLAEDAVQETLLAAYKSRDNYDPARPFRSWLWAIHVNNCRKIARQRGMTASDCLPGSLLLDLPGRELSAEVRLEQADDRERLCEVLELLPADQADAIRMRFFGDLGYEEIGEATQCSSATAKSRVRYGLAKMAKLLETGQEIIS